MKVSIVTVCYNSERTIEDTLLSIHAQDYVNIEHIVVDGGSTDGTLDIINRYKDKISILISEKDNGIYDAMNKGIARSTGDIIGTLNSDDIYKDSNVISRVVYKMSEEKLDALYADVEYFNDTDPTNTVRRYVSKYFTPEKIAYGWMPAHPTLFLHNKIYKKFGTFKTDYRISSDYEFIARIFYRTQLHYAYMPEVLVRMRIGGISTCSLKNTLLLNKEVLRACRENSVPTNMLKILSKYPAKLLGVIFK
jgi:glycosyltransferase involved in cell wall biosynthesis